MQSSGPPSAEINLAMLGPRASACDDFYAFACKGWLDKTKIPPDEEVWRYPTSEMAERNRTLLRSIVEDDSAGGGDPADSYRDQIGNLWASCMDLPQVNRRAGADLQAVLAPIEQAVDSRTLAAVSAQLFIEQIDVLFGFASGRDVIDSSNVIGTLTASGWGLLNPNAYLDLDEKARQLRVEYRQHVARMFALAGESRAQAKADSASVVFTEKILAAASLLNPPDAQFDEKFRRVDLAGLKRLAPSFDWTTWFTTLGLHDIGAIDVQAPTSVSALEFLITHESFAELRAYLRWRAIDGISAALSDEFLREKFSFWRAQTGQEEPPPRWRQCLEVVDAVLGEPLGHSLARRASGGNVSDSARLRMAALEAALRKKIEQASWLDVATRERALAKLDLVATQIGTSSASGDYSELHLNRGSYVGNWIGAAVFATRRDLARIGKVDRTGVRFDAQDLRATYQPSLNLIAIPAGILQPPVLDLRSNEATNDGAIGTIMGHELSHAFDDRGRRFEGHGNFAQWWTPQSGHAFDEHLSCIERQAVESATEGEFASDPKATLGENVADLGGVSLAYEAYEASGSKSANVGGYTAEQQFFIAYAQINCAQARDEALRFGALGSHAPPRFRVNAPLSNLPAFRAAFKCREGDKMVRPEHERCEIW